MSDTPDEIRDDDEEWFQTEDSTQGEFGDVCDIPQNPDHQGD